MREFLPLSCVAEHPTSFAAASSTLRPLRPRRGRLPARGLLHGGRGRPVEAVAEVVGADARHDLVVLDGGGDALGARHNRPRHTVRQNLPMNFFAILIFSSLDMALDVKLSD